MYYVVVSLVYSTLTDDGYIYVCITIWINPVIWMFDVTHICFIQNIISFRTLDREIKAGTACRVLPSERGLRAKWYIVQRIYTQKHPMRTSYIRLLQRCQHRGVMSALRATSFVGQWTYRHRCEIIDRVFAYTVYAHIHTMYVCIYIGHRYIRVMPDTWMIFC